MDKIIEEINKIINVNFSGLGNIILRNCLKDLKINNESIKDEELTKIVDMLLERLTASFGEEKVNEVKPKLLKLSKSKALEFLSI